MIPVIDKIKERYHIDKVVIVADSALMSKINLQTLESKEIKYVISARVKNTDEEIQKQILDLKSYERISIDIDNDRVIQDEIKCKIIQSKIGDSLVVYHSTKRARKDAFNREKDIGKIKKYINSTAKSKLTGRLKKPYVKIRNNCKIEIDLQKLEQQKEFDAKELLSTYRGLWQVEQTFRIVKSNLEIRPVFHYTPRRIKAHFAICYMALAMVR